MGASTCPFLNGEDALPSIAVHTPKKNESTDPRRKTRVHRDLFRAPKQKQCKRPSTDKCISKMWYIETTTYYSAIKKSEVMIFATACMDPENTLSERSQIQRPRTV